MSLIAECPSSVFLGKSLQAVTPLSVTMIYAASSQLYRSFLKVCSPSSSFSGGDHAVERHAPSSARFSATASPSSSSSSSPSSSPLFSSPCGRLAIVSPSVCCLSLFLSSQCCLYVLMMSLVNCRRARRAHLVSRAVSCRRAAGQAVRPSMVVKIAYLTLNRRTRASTMTVEPRPSLSARAPYKSMVATLALSPLSLSPLSPPRLRRGSCVTSTRVTILPRCKRNVHAMSDLTKGSNRPELRGQSVIAHVFVSQCSARKPRRRCATLLIVELGA